VVRGKGACPSLVFIFVDKGSLYNLEWRAPYCNIGHRSFEKTGFYATVLILVGPNKIDNMLFLLVTDPDPELTKRSGYERPRIGIRNTGHKYIDK
jgi:hypothetical protein